MCLPLALRHCSVVSLRLRNSLNGGLSKAVISARCLNGSWPPLVSNVSLNGCVPSKRSHIYNISFHIRTWCRGKGHLPSIPNSKYPPHSPTASRKWSPTLCRYAVARTAQCHAPFRSVPRQSQKAFGSRSSLDCGIDGFCRRCASRWLSSGGWGYWLLLWRSLIAWFHFRSWALDCWF